MRENCTYGSEGGGIELNRSFLPLSAVGTAPVGITVMVLTATPDHERNAGVQDGRQRSRRFMVARPRA